MTEFERSTDRADAGVTVDFDALYRGSWLSMVRLATLLLGDVASAEDSVQDAFVGVYRHRDRVNDPDRTVAYLRVAVVNSCRSRQRRRLSIARTLARIDRPNQALEAKADADDDVMRALYTLPRRQREVLVLRYWADLSETEIARTLSISNGTVKSSASRGLAALRASLETTDD